MARGAFGLRVTCDSDSESNSDVDFPAAPASLKAIKSPAFSDDWKHPKFPAKTKRSSRLDAAGDQLDQIFRADGSVSPGPASPRLSAVTLPKVGDEFDDFFNSDDDDAT